nr:hypothetical protein Csa_6G499875 [Ipomoea batatas]
MIDLSPPSPRVFSVALQIRQNREVLLVAAIAGVHLGAMALPEVILDADCEFQRAVFLVCFVPRATDERAREPGVPAWPSFAAAFPGLRQHLQRHELSFAAEHHAKGVEARRAAPLTIICGLGGSDCLKYVVIKICGLGGNDEGSAVDYNMVYGSGDLNGHHAYLFFAEENVVGDRDGEEFLEGVHFCLDVSKVQQRNSEL